MNRLTDTVNKMTVEADRLGNLVSQIRDKLTPEELQQFSDIRGNLLNQFQNVLGSGERVQVAYEGLRSLCLPQ